MNLCAVCKPKIRRGLKEFNTELLPFSDSCREREFRGWLYENYRLPDDILELFESMFENDVETDFETDDDDDDDDDDD